MNGVTYKKPCILAIRPGNFFENPVFAQVQDVYVVDSLHVHLYVKILDTTEYNEHFSAYIVKHTSEYQLVPLHHFTSYLPLHVHKISSFPGSLCVVPKFLIK